MAKKYIAIELLEPETNPTERSFTEIFDEVYKVESDNPEYELLQIPPVGYKGAINALFKRKEV